jgi:hypothetical protein
MSESPPTVTVTIDPRQRINAPSIALMITGIVGGLLSLLMLIFNVFGFGLGALIAEEAGEDALEMLFSGGLGAVSSLVGLAIAGFIIYGASKMKDLLAWGVAVAASIVAMIPCVSPCCVLGLPIGIWCLVVLFDQQVKSAFN